MLALPHIHEWQLKQLERIAALIGGDYSNSVFDGRDVREWICNTIDGVDLNEKLTRIEKSYE